MKLKKYLFCLLSSTALTLAAHSQSAEPSGGASGEIRLRTLGLSNMAETKIYYQTGGSFEVLPITYFRPSASFTASISEDGALPLFTRDIDSEGGYLYNVHSSVSFPADSRQIIVFASSNGEQVGFRAVADNLSSNARDWLYINTTQTPIAVQLGEANKPVALPPGQSVAHKAEVQEGSGAAIRVAVYEESGWKRIYSRFWPIYENQRSMVIFVEQAGKIRVYNLFDAVSQ
ncbi:MAG TPA: hypothetical protein DCX06_06270 [Opitutae bacterium]|nr:hypothetical protein [Opitutae bacterium]